MRVPSRSINFPMNRQPVPYANLKREDNIAVSDLRPSKLNLQRRLQQADHLPVHVIHGRGEKQQPADQPARVARDSPSRTRRRHGTRDGNGAKVQSILQRSSPSHRRRTDIFMPRTRAIGPPVQQMRSHDRLPRRKLPALQRRRAATLPRLRRRRSRFFDYHCHLPPKDIAENRRFANLFEIWLEGDHYKWRAMRANGVAERYITGDATPYEKFLAWARTVPYTLRNPLYHWTHLELQRYFGITDLLDENSAPAIWERANAALAQRSDRPRHSAEVSRGSRLHDRRSDRRPQPSPRDREFKSATRVFPAFRPDKALAIGTPEFSSWIQQALEAAANIDIRDLASFLDALRQRHDDFHSHGLPPLRPRPGSSVSRLHVARPRAAAIFSKAREGQAASAEEERTQFASFMMLVLRPPRRRKRMDQATPSRRPPQRELRRPP